MIAQCPVNATKLGLGVVRLDLIDPLRVVDLSPEVISMGLRSVMAFVDLGNDHSQHLTLTAGKRRFAAHDHGVEIHASL